MNGESFRVLLVEDNPVQADLIRHMLRQSGRCWELQHAPRLEAALAMARERPPTVVLLDLNLPDSQGLEGFRRLHRELPRLPVVILTNVADEELVHQAIQEGAQDYLIKRDLDSGLLDRSLRYAIDRQRYEEALLESEQRYALAVDGANDGLWDWDLAHDTVYFSPRWKAMLGLEEGEFQESVAAWFALIHEDDLPAFRRELEAHLEGAMEHFQHEHRIRSTSGEYLWVLTRGMAVRDEQGRPWRIAGSMSDITARKLAEEQLTHDALHDALTGLPNRSLFLDRLEQALAEFRRNREDRFAVLYFDLDRFKSINDSLGHLIGDRLLVACARRLHQNLRPGDTLARLGGDEFTILVRNVTGLTDVIQVAERVHELLTLPFELDDHTIFTSASIGIAWCDPRYEWPQDMLRDADLAMYRAKHGNGSHCYEVFDSDMHESAMALLKLETDLHEALREDQFLLNYQPIVNLEGGWIEGFEALIRWRHPQRGLLQPGQFIAVAEETGIICDICWWVLEEACRQLRAWQRIYPQEHGPLSMSVNISGKLFAQPGMVDRLEGIIRLNDLEPSTLNLEITESGVMDHCEQALRALEHLRGLGIQLHLDDFGTGYSSLSYLQRFNYDTIKIDRSFVARMPQDEGSRSIVEALATLGRTMGMRVIAEGVENIEQYRILREMGCTEAQGYWFSHPVDSREVTPMLKEPRFAIGRP